MPLATNRSDLGNVMRRWAHGKIDFTFNTSHSHQICQIVSTMLYNAHKTGEQRTTMLT